MSLCDTSFSRITKQLLNLFRCQSVHTSAKRNYGHRWWLTESILTDIVQARQRPADRPISTTDEDLEVRNVAKYIQTETSSTSSAFNITCRLCLMAEWQRQRKDGRITMSRMNFAGYVGHVVISIYYLVMQVTTSRCSVVRVSVTIVIVVVVLTPVG